MISMDVRCPLELRDLKGWLVWRYVQLPGEQKARKMPFYADGGKRWGKHGSKLDRSRLVTFDKASEAAAVGDYEGVGLAMLADWNLVVLDFDAIGDHWPEIEKKLHDTYVEWSPSGKGIHAFMWGVLPDKKSSARDWPYGFETFHKVGFVTFTGNQLNDLTCAGIVDVTPEILALFDERFGEKQRAPREERPASSVAPMGLGEEQIVTAIKAIDPDSDYDKWLRVGMAIHHETDGEGLHIWDEWSQGGGKYPSYEELRDKWESFGRHAGNPVTMRTVVKEANANGAVVGVVSKPEEFPLLEDPAVEKPKTRNRFEVVPAGEFARRPPPLWWLEGMIPKADLVTFYGESGAGKSFVVLDIVAAICRGVDWRGLKTRQARGVYIVAEGGGGFSSRLLAYEKHHGVSFNDVPLGIVKAVPSFLVEKDKDDLQAAIQLASGADLIVVDTFAQVTAGGNENSAEDMGTALKNCRELAEALGATVILIHHSGKDQARGARGWSGIKAASDAEFVVTPGLLRNSKQKDARDGGKWGFRLHEVEVGRGDYDAPISSCVIVEHDIKDAEIVDAELTPDQRAILKTLQEMALGPGQGVEIGALAEAVVQGQGVEPAKEKDAKTNTVRRIKALATTTKSGRQARLVITETGAGKEKIQHVFFCK